jgi:hypothetical protein
VDPVDARGDQVELIPVSHLGLDVPAPPSGWLVELNRRGIEVSADGIGRPSVSCDVARLLLEEHRQSEARKQAKREAAERAAIEADQRRFAQLYRGVPVAEGLTGTEALLAAAAADSPRRRNPVAAALDGESMTFHSYESETQDEWQ